MSCRSIQSPGRDPASRSASPRTEDISYGISGLNIAHNVTDDVRTWWFLPTHLILPSLSSKPSASRWCMHVHIPKPRNSYELFRSHLSQRVLPRGIAFLSKQVSVSRVAGHVWRRLPLREKARFDVLFIEEQRLHKQRFPEYVIQDKGPSCDRRSKVKDIEDDEHSKKCKKIADLLLANVHGEELVTKTLEIVNTRLQPGWLKLIAPAPTNPRISSTTPPPRMGITGAEATISMPARRAANIRIKEPRVDPKVRSSSSRMQQSKRTMTGPRFPTIDPRRLTQPPAAAFDDRLDFCWEDGPSYLPHETSRHHFAGSGDVPPGCFDSSIDSSFDIPSQFLASSILEGNWTTDMTVEAQPLEANISLKTYQDINMFSAGQGSTYTVLEMNYSDESYDQKPAGRPENHSFNLDEVQMAVGQDFVASMESETTSPECLH